MQPGAPAPHGSPPIPSAPGPSAPPARENRARFWIGLAFATIVVGAGFAGAYYALRADSPDGRRVAVYVTDLAGGFENLRFTISAVTVGEFGDPLPVLVSDVDIGSLHGPEQALKVAEGTVPFDADGTVALTLAGVEGRKGETWQRLELPSPQLVVQDALLPGEFPGEAVIFDFDLDASIVASDEGYSFHPLLANLYQFGDPSGRLRFDLAQDASRFVRIEDPQQYRTSTREETSECATVSRCESLGSEAPAPSPEKRPTHSNRQDVAPINLPPVVSGSPAPADGARRLGLAPTLTWTGGHPQGKSVTYKVIVNGRSECEGTATATCALAGLVAGTEYKWRVVARDAKGLEVSSPEWRFTTNFAPGMPILGTPANASIDQPRSLNLTWTGTDPDGDALTYTIYLSSNPPPLSNAKCRDTAGLLCATGTLAYEIKYYWQVEASDGMLSTKGPIWDFTTEEDDGGASGDLPGLR